MQDSIQRDSLRFSMALGAVLVALAICQIQQHFQIIPSDPATWLLLFQHRCGLVFATSCAWACFEGLRLLVRPPQRMQNS